MQQDEKPLSFNKLNYHRCARSMACILALVHAEMATAMADLVTARIVTDSRLNLRLNHTSVTQSVAHVQEKLECRRSLWCTSQAKGKVVT
jgi:hypothetical protein